MRPRAGKKGAAQGCRTATRSAPRWVGLQRAVTMTGSYCRWPGARMLIPRLSIPCFAAHLHNPVRLQRTPIWAAAARPPQRDGKPGTAGQGVSRDGGGAGSQAAITGHRVAGKIPRHVQPAQHRGPRGARGACSRFDAPCSTRAQAPWREPPARVRRQSRATGHAAPALASTRRALPPPLCSAPAPQRSRTPPRCSATTSPSAWASGRTPRRSRRSARC